MSTTTPPYVLRSVVTALLGLRCESIIVGKWQEAVFRAAEDGLTRGGRIAEEAELEKQLCTKPGVQLTAPR